MNEHRSGHMDGFDVVVERINFHKKTHRQIADRNALSKAAAVQDADIDIHVVTDDRGAPSCQRRGARIRRDRSQYFANILNERGVGGKSR